MCLEQSVEGSQLRLGADHDDDTLAGDLSVGERGHEPSAVPHTDDIQPGPLPQPCFANGQARKRGVPRRELADLQLREGADDARPTKTSTDAIC